MYNVCMLYVHTYVNDLNTYVSTHLSIGAVVSTHLSIVAVVKVNLTLFDELVDERVELKMCVGLES